MCIPKLVSNWCTVSTSHRDSWKLHSVFAMADWAAWLLVCGILRVGAGIPLGDFYPFGATVKDFTVGPTLDGNNSTLLDQEFPFFNKSYHLIYVSLTPNKSVFTVRRLRCHQTSRIFYRPRASCKNWRTLTGC